MKDDLLLKKYYEERLMGIGMPEWNTLDENQRMIVYKTTNFAFYRLDNSWQELKNEFKKLFSCYK